MREKTIEHKLVKAVKAEGGMCPKLVSPGTDGMPDRMVLLPEAHIGFVEVKAPGEKPRPLQVRRHEQLRELGFQVSVLDDPEQIPGILKEVQDICGLDKVLQTHVGRKTYVCYLYQKQVPVQVIATIVGHTTCYTTLKYYAKMDKQTIFKELHKI